VILACAATTAVHTAEDAAAAPKPSTASPNVHVLPAMAIPGLGRERTIRLYLPPGYDDSLKAYPVLYMHDGQNLFDAATSFAGEWQVDETLDAMARDQGLELIVVGIDNGAGHRLQELTAWDTRRAGHAEGAAYVAFIVDVVKPYIDANYRTLRDRSHTAIMGSSLGGLISHYAIHRYPDVFGKAGLFSPSYWYAPQAYDYTDAHRLPRDTKLYFYCGGKEDERMVGNMQHMVQHERRSGLAAQSIRVDVDPDAQHNEAAWGREFPKAIVWLFGETGSEPLSGGR
jgi:alpha-glucosidase